MVTRIDDKGKVFTERVRKQVVDVTVYTATCVFKGQLHIQADQRLRDDLNNSTERFVALTNAEVRTADQARHLQSAPFMVINKDTIIAVVPTEK